MFKFFISILLFINLVACATREKAPPCVVSLREHNIYVEQLQNRQACLQRLCKLGVQVIKLGDEVEINVPSDLLFRPNTGVLIPKSGIVFDTIICLLHKKLNYGVKIVANTYCCPTKAARAYSLALAEQQALVVADYFARNGLDARVIFSKGRDNLPRNCCPYVSVQTRLMQLEDVE
jgi:outer membrane protein OmpA-like peptidoglycan-associated protein